MSAAVVLLASARQPAAAPEPLRATAAFSGFELPTPKAAPSTAPPGDQDEAGCGIADQGMGRYGAPRELPVGGLVVPEPAPTGQYDLLLHLHGGIPARRLLAPADLGLVIATVDLGVGSRPYAEAFYGPEPLEELLAAVGKELAPARLRHLIVSSWSAGYGAVREILAQHPASISGLILLDSVHASYTPAGDPQPEGIAPFIAYAERAKLGEGVLVLTHSEIQPPGYASTHEVANAILEAVGTRRQYAGLVPQFGVELKTTADDGGFHLRGFTGNGKDAHCAHMRLLPGLLKDVVLPALD